jgi:hypothetical protein
MEQFLQQIASGLATGAIYACVALALVMIYVSIGPHQFRPGRDGDVLDLPELAAHDNGA